MNPKVSVIIPAYNAEQYLDKCLQSVKNQSFTNWECIVVNDGSVDATGSICDTWAKYDSRFNVFHKQNGGQASARNLALQHASGEFIMFLDSDDYYYSDDLLEILVDEMEINPSIDMIQFPIIAVYSDGNVGFSRQPTKETLFRSNEEILKAFEAKKISTIVAEKIIRRSSIKRSITFPEGMYFEDECYVVDLLQQLKTVKITTKGLYYYILHDGSTTHQEFNLRHTRDLFKKDIHGIEFSRKYPYLENLYLEYYRGAFREYKNAQIFSDNIELAEYIPTLTQTIPSWNQIFNSKGYFSVNDKITLVLTKLFGYHFITRLSKRKIF